MYKLLLFLIQHHILLYLFVNTPFKFYSIGSEFTKFCDENDKLLFNVEKFVIIEALFAQSLNKYLR